MEHAGREWRKGGPALTNEYVASKGGVEVPPWGPAQPRAGADVPFPRARGTP